MRWLALTGAILLHCVLVATALTSQPKNHIVTEPRVIEITLSAPVDLKAPTTPEKTEKSAKPVLLKPATESTLRRGGKQGQSVQPQTQAQKKEKPLKPLPLHTLANVTPQETEKVHAPPAIDAVPTPQADSLPDPKEAEAENPMPAQEKASPRYHENPPPEYPLLARKRGLEGTVELEVLVNRQGVAEKVRLARSSSHTLLDRAAMNAVGRWLFLPGKQGAENIDMWVRVPIRYALND